jgi:glycine cleavage system transcriptional repressor
MERYFIMTAFGKDRTGIVADVARLIYESGCNLEDSTMARLMDAFAMILLFSGNSARLEDDLAKGCRRLEIEKGVSAFFRPLENKGKSSEKSKKLHTLCIEGVDHAGIVYGVSDFLAKKNINIEKLRSETKPSPESGTTHYLMEIGISVPAELSLEELDRELARIGEALNVDIARSN